MSRFFQDRSVRSPTGASRDVETMPASGGILLAEVCVASLIVVGLFDAACQPPDWPCITQLVGCAVLGSLLWLADNQLERAAAIIPADGETADGRKAFSCRSRS